MKAVNTNRTKNSRSLWNNAGITGKRLFLKRYYALNMSIYEMEPHEHGEVEIMYVVYGECEITYFDQEGTRYTRKLKKEEYVILDAFVRHSLYVERGENCKILNLEMEVGEAGTFRWIQELCQKSDSVMRFLKEDIFWLFLQDKNNEIYTLIQRLQESEKSGTDKEEHRIGQNLYLQQLLLVLARQARTRRDQNRGNLYVKKTKEYLEDNYENDIRISELGEKLGISEAHLQRVYKQTEGESIITTLNKIRMGKACVLLTDSKLPIIDVAVSVGFHNRQHFNYIFTKMKGCSPARYRKLKGNMEVYEGFLQSNETDKE